MKSHLLVDAHALGYAAQEATALTANGIQVQALFGVIKRVRASAESRRYHSIHFLWDGKTSRRNTVFPGYKAKRAVDPKMQEMRQQFRAQIPLIKNAMLQLGIHQYYSATSEADDLAGALSRKMVEQGDQVTLLTADRDWLQLVNDNVTWISNRTDRIVTSRNFVGETNCLNVRQFIENKALKGDASDCIPGVGMIGEKGAVELLERFGSVVTFIKAFRAGELDPKGLPKPWRDLATNAEHKTEAGMGRLDVFKRNVQIMTLRTGVLPDDLATVHRPLNAVGFKGFCQQYNFQSILENFEFFLEPFKFLE